MPRHPRMSWRDWIEELKDMGESLVATIEGGRRLTPFFMCGTADDTDGYPLSPEHFEDDDRLNGLVGLMLSLIREKRPERCAWLLNADVKYLRTGDRVEMPESLVLAAVDREREETWVAPIHRFDSGGAVLGVWSSWPANATTSQMLDPLQEALR